MPFLAGSYEVIEAAHCWTLSEDGVIIARRDKMKQTIVIEGIDDSEGVQALLNLPELVAVHTDN